ncbi:MAG: GGDEF domain-containing protein [bacterium]|nr:GGDEF domain-containing protein [bacterium]
MNRKLFNLISLTVIVVYAVFAAIHAAYYFLILIGYRGEYTSVHPAVMLILAAFFHSAFIAFLLKTYFLKKEVSALSEAKHYIEEMAIKDELTGLYNRRYLFDQLEKEMKRAHRGDYSIGFIMIDIDHFKKFNDIHGHQIGDLVLREVARSIMESCRDVDTVSRYGGEEIAVIAPQCSHEYLYELAERIRERVNTKKVETLDGALSVSVSQGTTSFDSLLLDSIGKPEVIIHFADVALYRAKERGRNRVEHG